jgi:PAS domain S-box-containing protein
MLEKCFRHFFFSGLEQKRIKTEAFKNRIVKLTNRIEKQMSDYDMLLNGVDTMIWLNYESDIQGKSNQAVLDFFGTTQEKLEGKNLRDLLPQEEAEICIRNNQEIFETGKSKVTYEWVTRYDGKKRLLKITKRPKINGVSYIVASAEDITELEEARNQLQNECNFTESLIDTAHALIVVLDTEGKIIRCNKYFESISGYSFSEIENKNWFDLFIKPSDRERLENILHSHVRENSNSFAGKGIINTIIAKNKQEILVEWYTKSLTDNLNSVIGVISVGQDIGERKIVEEELWAKILELEIKIQKLKPAESNIFINKEYMGKETILLVDDESSVLDVLSMVLQQHGYNVLSASSASGALSFLEKTKEIDLIISDLYIPEINGIEIIDKVKKEIPDISYLIISGAKYSESLNIPEKFFFPKPFLLEDFIKKVYDVLTLRRK